MSKIDKYYFNHYHNLYDFNDKDRCVSNLITYMLSRTQRMFKYKGLPESIPAHVFEEFLQTNGNVCVAQVSDTLYAFTGGLGGEPNVYYEPTLYIVANPALNLSKSFVIDKDCVVIRNTSMWQSILPLFSRYATAIMENEISMRIMSINSRHTNVFSAGDDRTYASALKYIDDIEKGKLGVISENQFLEGVKVHPTANTSGQRITDLIEYQQYLKASWYNELGLNSNFNMKRERLTENESEMNVEILMPLADDMLANRKDGLEKVNAMYGTNITVEFDSSWNKENKYERSENNDSEVSEDVQSRNEIEEPVS